MTGKQVLCDVIRWGSPSLSTLMAAIYQQVGIVDLSIRFSHHSSDNYLAEHGANQNFQ